MSLGLKVLCRISLLGLGVTSGLSNSAQTLGADATTNVALPGMATGRNQSGSSAHGVRVNEATANSGLGLKRSVALTGAVSLRGPVSPALLAAPTAKQASREKVPVKTSGGTDAQGLAVGAILSPAIPPGAIVVSPSSDIPSVIVAAPVPSTFYFNPGTYRNLSISPRDGDTFVGAAGAILKGSTLISSFGSSGAYWTISDQAQNPTDNAQCKSDFPLCNNDTDVFWDSVPLTQVASLAAVHAGSFFFDHNAQTIYLGANPNGHVVEVDVTPTAFNPTGSNVTIQNLVIEEYASLAQQGAIAMIQNGYGNVGISGWTLDHLTVSLNHGTGVALAASSSLRNSWIHDNGHLGVGAVETHISVLHNDLGYNGWNGTACGWECGNLKFFAVASTVISYNNVHHANGQDGSGLWCDIACNGVTEGFNSVHDNPGPGIFYEISCFGTIFNNTLVNNGWNISNPGYLWGGAILISASHDVTVSGNTLVGNYNGITAVSQNRGDQGSCGSTVVANLAVSRNSTTLAAGSFLAAGLITDAGYNQIYRDGNTWTNNAYHLGSSGENWGHNYFSWNGDLIERAAWQANGLDPSPSTFGP